MNTPEDDEIFAEYAQWACRFQEHERIRSSRLTMSMPQVGGKDGAKLVQLADGKWILTTQNDLPDPRLDG